MSAREALWVTGTVEEINRALALSSLRNGWSFTATVDLFRGHGYCADDTWFRGAAESKHLQGNTNGTAHPNTAGHSATAQRVRQTIRIDEPVPPVDQLSVSFRRVRVSHDHDADFTETFVGMEAGFQSATCQRRFNQTKVRELKVNRWTDLSADPCMRYEIRTVGRTIGLSVRVFLSNRGTPREPRVPPGGQPSSVAARSRPSPSKYNFTLMELHRRRDGWDATSAAGPGCVKRAVGQRKGVRIEFEYQLPRESPVPTAPCQVLRRRPPPGEPGSRMLDDVGRRSPALPSGSVPRTSGLRCDGRADHAPPPCPRSSRPLERSNLPNCAPPLVVHGHDQRPSQTRLSRHEATPPRRPRNDRRLAPENRVPNGVPTSANSTAQAAWSQTRTGSTARTSRQMTRS